MSSLCVSIPNVSSLSLSSLEWCPRSDSVRWTVRGGACPDPGRQAERCPRHPVPSLEGLIHTTLGHPPVRFLTKRGTSSYIWTHRFFSKIWFQAGSFARLRLWRTRPSTPWPPAWLRPARARPGAGLAPCAVPASPPSTRRACGWAPLVSPRRVLWAPYPS